MKSIAEKSLEVTGLFEAELLVRLMLWRWGHPLVNDEAFANGLLESAADALQSAAEGEQLIEGLPATSLNLVAAIWYAETCAIESGETDAGTIEARKAWLFVVRKTLPSCFCDPSDLHQA
jgi:hypothetical protein